MRPRAELIQKGLYPLAQRLPVPRRAMQFQHVLPQPAPQLLNRIEPGRIGRQPDRLNLRPAVQRGLHILMAMNRPIVLHDIDRARPRDTPASLR